MTLSEFGQAVAAEYIAEIERRLAAMTPPERERFMIWFVNARPR